MRIRQLKPEWWDDKPLQTRLTPGCREFYIGLWQNADDAGYLRWDPDAIAAGLYPYKGVASRERQVRRWSEDLKALDPDSPHLVLLDCGRHARVPKMPGHQVVAATRRWTKYAQEHTTQCLDSALAMTSQEGTVRKGMVRNGGVQGGVAPSPSEAGRSHLEVVDGEYRVKQR